MPADLHWLPEPPGDWSQRLAALKTAAGHDKNWASLVQLANHRVDFVQTTRLDRVLQRSYAAPPSSLATKPVKLALLSSSTVAHLLPGIRVGALRRGIWTEVYEAAYGQYWQELIDQQSGLHQFHPNVVLFSLDARHLASSLDATPDSTLEMLTSCWQRARDAFDCTVIQQTALPVLAPLLGNNEHQLRESPRWKINELNFKMHATAAREGVLLLAADSYAESDGVNEWYDPALWHRAKQEIHPRVSHIYGDLLGRLLAAEQGRSFKCAALDLDNTLWGGVIGDDGIAGIHLGQGHAVGEAYIEFQRYLQALASRGIILAVCSKNDEENARLPFSQHAEMVLKETDIACFAANWNDKAANLRHIAKTLNIGLDAIVFVDDNPFERNLVRQELPMVAVPELPEDPSLYIGCLSGGGYFEGLSVTAEDRKRGEQYRANLEREQARDNSTDLQGYLRGLRMELLWNYFDSTTLSRVAQLINKTNQFNLTTQRYSESDVASMMVDPNVMGLHFRLLDRFGDNGIISIVIGRLASPDDLFLDSWLMSCRVLGRQVEETTLNIVAAAALGRGVKHLVGEYRPTAKNGMVKHHYEKLGFQLVSENPDGSSRWILDLNSYQQRPSPIRTVEP